MNALITSIDEIAPPLVERTSQIDPHTWGMGAAIAAITLGRRVRLVRRIMSVTSHDMPGEVEGRVTALSNHIDAGLRLVLEDGDDQVVVDVSDPRDWLWEVT